MYVFMSYNLEFTLKFDLIYSYTYDYKLQEEIVRWILRAMSYQVIDIYDSGHLQWNIISVAGIRE